MKKYTLKEFNELEKRILKLRIAIKNGDIRRETIEKLALLEIEYEKVSSQISWDIENGELDYGDDTNIELKTPVKVKKINNSQ